MKRLVLGMFCAALTSQLGACFISSDDSSDGTTDPQAKIAATWHFESVAKTNTGCPPDVQGIAVVTQTLDVNGNVTGQPITDIFDCGDMQGITAGLPPQTLNVYLKALGAGDAPLYTTLSQTVDITTTNKSLDFRFISDGGFFVFDWDLRANGAPISCAANPDIDGVEIVATVSGGSQATSDQFNCEDGYGATDPILAGSYTVSIDAFMDTPTGGVLVGQPTNLANQPISAPSGITDLGTVVIETN